MRDRLGLGSPIRARRIDAAACRRRGVHDTYVEARDDRHRTLPRVGRARYRLGKHGRVAMAFLASVKALARAERHGRRGREIRVNRERGRATVLRIGLMFDNL